MSVGSSTASVSKSALERLRKKRALDAESVKTLVALGWRQAAELDGILWCSTCVQPTVWKDASGVPSHVWCSDALDAAPVSTGASA